MKRADGRAAGEIRPVKITRNYLKSPQGSVLIEAGDTKVICTAIVQEKVPDHKRGTKSGWVTAEYAMLPGSTTTRAQREKNLKGRTAEIQRLIGRALRAVVDMDKLGERTIMIDADVIQADGGTRTAAITGAFVALKDAVGWLLERSLIAEDPIKEHLAAVSVGVIDGASVSDLPYAEDVRAEVDMNVVMTESGKIVEVQGTAEGRPFSKKKLDQLLELADKSIKKLIAIQKKALKE